MALGTVGIDVRTKAVRDRGGHIRQSDHLRIVWNVSIIDRRIEQSQMIERTQLVICDARGWVIEVAVQLPGLESEDIISGWCVAGQTIAAAGVVPGLRPHSNGIRN